MEFVVDGMVAERPNDGSPGIHAPVGVVGTMGCRGATIEIRETHRTVVGPISRFPFNRRSATKPINSDRNRALKRPATINGRFATETPALHGFLVEVGECDVLVAERPCDGSRGFQPTAR
jgi:hypothetical protein